MILRTIAYVDGYNLYYGRLQGTPYKWLDLQTLIRELLHVQNPSFDLTQVKYFTAPVLGSLATRGADSVAAQNSYLRALEASGVEIATSLSRAAHHGAFPEAKLIGRI